MTKLLFDGTAMQSTSTAKFHGGGEYAKFIFKRMVDLNLSFDLVLDQNRELDENINNLLADKFKGTVVSVTSNQEIYDLCKIGRYQRLFTAHPYEYQDYNGSSEFIGVIHGLRGIELPWDDFKYKFYDSFPKRLMAFALGKIPFFINHWQKKQIKKIEDLIKIPNSKYFTVSNHSKYSILNFFPELTEDKLKVVYSPFSPLKGIKHPIDVPYFLMVSGNRYEKNVFRAAKAFDNLFSKDRLHNFKVIITGSGRKGIWRSLKNIDKFELKGYVSYEELGDLYANAFCFVYPSLNEGFGYPPLYAMGLGVPVIASSATSIPEVCADAVCYFSPLSVSDLQSRLLHIANDECFRNELINRGYIRYNKLLADQSVGIDYLIDSITK